MTSTELRDILDLLGWSQNRLAQVLERDSHDVRRWAQGQADIPAEDAAWLLELAKVWQRKPTRAARRAAQ